MSESATYEFKAEVSALLRLVTNSLYTNPEIFLRELLSNASDALDNARFQAVQNAELLGQQQPPCIQITADPNAGVLVIEDNGIGMTPDELAQNLGTIAHSGTLEFLEGLGEQGTDGAKPDLSLIGQFGVGFYSAFMVADEITVHSLSAQPGNEPGRWTSSGDGTFTVGSSDRKTRGTRIDLHLKEEAKEFLERLRIEAIVKRYSNYIMHPIMFKEAGADEQPVQLNQASAFWTRPPRELEDSDYSEFYKHAMGGFVLPGDEPLARLHFSMDAPIQFHSLLFVPSRAPMDLFQEEHRGLQLFAKRVMVVDNSDKLLPSYLRFFRGVVDSEDLPLNVSREMLQEHKALSAIRRQLTRKSLKLLAELSEADEETYTKLWREFGAVIKEGIHTDNGHRDELAKLLRFSATGCEDEFISLDAYVDAMPTEQDAIYYITGGPNDNLDQSPHLEVCKSRGYKVLLMTDAVDEWVVEDLHEYREKPLRNVTQGDFSRADGEPPAPDSLAALVKKSGEVLGDRVKAVRPSRRLTESAACLVDEEGGLSRNMERILRQANRPVTSRPRVLELNPEHSFVQAAQHLACERPDDPRLITWIELLLDQAHLAEGRVPDPGGIVRRIQSILDETARTGD